MSLAAGQKTANSSTATNEKKPSAEPSLFEAFSPLEGKRLEILDENGTITNAKWLPALSDDQLLNAYRLMLLARIADLKAVSLQRQGRLFTLPPSQGQEAAAVGSAMALEKTDWMAPAYRELGAWLVMGVPLSKVYLYFGGSEFGNQYPANVNVLPTSVPISSQLLHAAGIGHAIRYKGGSGVVITYFGDGGTSEGDFHEALNWAAVFNCPVIFFCNNNQYAISCPRSKQTKSETIAQKAVAYGMPGIHVDGNDFLAVHRATRDAAAYARAGHGPVLIEAETYRLGAHTTSDDPSKYREKEEEEIWKTRDPLLRMKKYLEGKKLWNDTQEEQAKDAAQKTADDAFREAEKFPMNTPEEIVTHAYEQPVPELEKQLDSLKGYLAWKEGR
jgi:pyruvate dehydrogenase E1 component alpha subunit